MGVHCNQWNIARALLKLSRRSSFAMSAPMLRADESDAVFLNIMFATRTTVWWMKLSWKKKISTIVLLGTQMVLKLQCLPVIWLLSFHGSGSQTVVRVPLVLREGFSGGTRAAFLSHSKSFVNSFLCYNTFECYANVANSFMCYIDLKYIWAHYVLLKPGVYTATLKKHQVVRDLKKFENHCLKPNLKKPWLEW